MWARHVRRQIPLAEKVIRTIVVYSVLMVWEPPRRAIVRA